MSRFYRRNISQSLQAALDEQLALKPDDQFNLFDELALVRTVAHQHVQVYSKALETNKQEAILAAGELMAVSLERVGKMCQMAAQLNDQQKDKFSIHDLNYIIEQIVRISFDCFGDDERCNQFALMVREQLDLRKNDLTTTSKPSDIVADMDNLTMGDPS